MPIRYEFEKELNRLQKYIIKIGAFIEESIEDMLEALKTGNIQLAESVIKKDDVIDEMERKVVSECLMIVARQQPIATDLRDIASILKIATDLERIADQCENISEYMIKLQPLKSEIPLEIIPKMAEAVKVMIAQTIDAYVRKDYELARKVIDSDDVIDDHFDDILEKLIQISEKDTKETRAASYYLLIAKYLERMGDHATNIAEWIVYYVTGEIQ